MPREGAIIFRDSAKKLDVLRGERGKCGHVGQYRAAPWSRYRSGHGAQNVTIVRASRSCVPKSTGAQKLEEIQQAATATTCSNYSTLSERKPGLQRSRNLALP